MNKGITLVILIITIVVTLILASAVFMVFTRNNIIDATKETVFKENIKLYKEEFDTKIAKERLKDRDFNIESLNIAGNELKTWIPSIMDEDIENIEIINGSVCYTGLNENEKEWVRQLELTVLEPTKTLFSSVAQVGQYVHYTPNGGTYNEATMLLTGTSADQSFTIASSKQVWRVLKTDNTSVTIIQGDLLEDKLRLKGKTGFQNAQVLLNGLCQVYTSSLSQSVRSVTVEDINEITGYTQAMMNNFGGGSNTNGGYGYEKTYDGIVYTSSYYTYKGSIMKDAQGDSYNMIFRSSADSTIKLSYWVASTCNGVYDHGISYCVRYVYNDGIEGNNIQDPDGSRNTGAIRIRPVVVLKPTVTVKENGDGTILTPWELE